MKFKIPIYIAAIGITVTSIFFLTPFFIANLPMFFSKTQRHSEISYGSEAWQKLDIYTPKKTTQSSPVLIFYHGGRWTFGKKEQYAFTALPFVKKGYIVVIPDYSKYPDVKFPTFVEDAALALSWTYDHISKYGGDHKKLYLAGHSSGAHLAALISANPAYLNETGKDRKIIKAFAGLAGPYNFIPEEKDLIDMFGPPENYPNMWISTFIDGNQPPMLLLHGAKDNVVKRINLDVSKEKIEEKGGVVVTKIYQDVDHIEIMGALSWVWRGKAPVAQDMLEFFERHP